MAYAGNQSADLLTSNLVASFQGFQVSKAYIISGLVLPVLTTYESL